jgi:hypothetical protein
MPCAINLLMRKQGIITHWQKKMLKENPPKDGQKDKDKDKRTKTKKIRTRKTKIKKTKIRRTTRAMIRTRIKRRREQG